MLVLTRKLDEAIRIGKDVKIVVVEIKRNQVRLGIEASAEIPVYREEIYLKVKNENILSADVSMESFKKLKEIVRK